MEQKDIIVPELNNATIESMIYTIRGQRVMLDFELAQIYGYETKTLNQQVKNNIEKFPERYRFQLTKEEAGEILRSKNLTASWGGRRNSLYAFTEQGVYMLMTVLKDAGKKITTIESIDWKDGYQPLIDEMLKSDELGL